MAGARAEQQDPHAFLEQTSEKLALCKRGLNILSKILHVLQEEVDTQSTTSLSRQQCDTLHDLTTALMTGLQTISISVTRLSQQCQAITDLFHQVSSNVPTFLRGIKLQHLQGNFTEVTTVHQLLKLENLEGEMKPVERRRLEREVGKIRARVQNGAGLSGIPPTMNQLQETITQLARFFLAKLEELLVSTDIKEEPGVPGWVYNKVTKFLTTMWNGPSNSEDTFTTRHRKNIEGIERDLRDLSPMSAFDNITPDLTELVLKNDLVTLSSFEESIANIRSELLNINSSIDEWYKQALAMAGSL
ncbi:uncharacterized protein LOC144926307 [Branchiostoma floridae x Branchiostoma belcheri]